ncbi:MAG: metallophosphoesterase, partial [Pseudomonadales bacterium]|nr:metallophosphoesterase [Pseudomonadales bacterium]
QPDFVMSVGEYSEGYTADSHVLAKQWAEIDAMVSRLEAPFFYVPGNHDHTNTVMADLWRTRFGKPWYHFVYKQVLFIVLNTEDPFPVSTPEMDIAWAKLGDILRTDPGNARDYLYSSPVLAPMLGQISNDQREEIVTAINEHPDVRWTFLFMHRPIWNKRAPSNYLAIEEALGDRNYTAFAGHEHSYMYLRRHDRDHMTLGTSGGGWQSATPPRQGQMDHITWVTVRDEGPVFAHILASGVIDKEGPPPFLPGAELCGGDTGIQCVYQKLAPVPPR